MKVYQIDYDLRKQRNYDALFERLKQYPSWCRPLKSSWLVASNDSAAQIRDNLKGAMDADDGLVVTRLQGDWATYGVSKEVSDWIRDKLSKCAA
jgi:hypothetical protein